MYLFRSQTRHAVGAILKDSVEIVHGIESNCGLS